MIAVAIVLGAPGVPTAWAAAAVGVLMAALWALSLRIHDVSIADPAWGPAFVVVAVVVALTGDGCVGRRWLLAALTALWGLRLGGYLLARKLGDRREDRRYAAVRDRRGDSFALWSLVGIFGLQGLLVLIVSLPLQVSAVRGGELTAWIIPGVAGFALGLFFEAVGDEQMRRFMADPANAGAVMDRGLWRFTRHPNYFGDFCVWVGVVADRAHRRCNVVDGHRSAGDERAARPRVGSGVAGEGHRGAPAGVSRLRPVHVRLHPAAAAARGALMCRYPPALAIGSWHPGLGSPHERQIRTYLHSRP